MPMAKLSRVVIVGRTNVGKSTLFNRLSQDVKSLALDYEGVTRDFLHDEVCWQNRCFELIDSGGISLKKSQDPVAEKVRILALALLEDADLILFVCDGKVEPTLDDIQMAKYLHKLGKLIILVINKIDEQYHVHEFMSSFAQLGFEYSVAVSALHGKGIADLLDTIIQLLPKQIEPSREEKEEECSIVFLGKPNVGKSSLMNALLEEERVLVAAQPGTTREAITESIKFYQETIMLTDTPGIRRKRAIDEPLEKLMVKTAFAAVERADIVALVIDGSEGIISDQALKLAFYIFEQGKGLVLLINKADLIDAEKQAGLDDSFSRYDYFFNKIPKLYISCITGKNIGKIIPLIAQVWQRCNQQFSDYELTTLFKQALERTPLFHATMPLILRRAEQIKVAPIKILLIVNQPSWFGPSQLAFFENRLRKKFDLVGAPVLFVTRKS